MYYHSLAFYHDDMVHVTTEQTTARHGRAGLAGAIPPHAYFLVSAVCHYLGWDNESFVEQPFDQ